MPVAPQRVVSASGVRDLEALLTLEAPLVAAAGDDDDLGGAVWLPHLAPLLEGVERLPSRRNINLEAIAATRPDLIVGLSGQIEDVYAQLAGIAPTVALDTQAEWRQGLLLVGEVLGRPASAEEALGRFDASADVVPRLSA